MQQSFSNLLVLLHYVCPELTVKQEYRVIQIALNLFLARKTLGISYWNVP